MFLMMYILWITRPMHDTWEPPYIERGDDVRPTSGPHVHIACIGDSITRGTYRPHSDYDLNYPNYLRYQINDYNYTVVNYAGNGACANKGMSCYYGKYPEFKRAIASNPDIVVLMIGSNDFYMKNWEDENRFVDGYRDLVMSFMNYTKKAP